MAIELNTSNMLDRLLASSPRLQLWPLPNARCGDPKKQHGSLQQQTWERKTQWSDNRSYCVWGRMENNNRALKYVLKQCPNQFHQTPPALKYHTTDKLNVKMSSIRSNDASVFSKQWHVVFPGHKMAGPRFKINSKVQGQGRKK